MPSEAAVEVVDEPSITHEENDWGKCFKLWIISGMSSINLLVMFQDFVLCFRPYEVYVQLHRFVENKMDAEMSPMP